MFKRLFDLLFSIILLLIFSIPLFLISIVVFLTSKGPIFHWSKRIGKDGILFLMPKFRTMVMDAPNLPSNDIQNPKQYITSIGGFLRKYSLDELPQLFCILIGDMSFVGPRPALYSQSELIHLREENHIDRVPPGLTGWAQVNGRDNISIKEKVVLDLFYVNNKSIFLDIRILCKTFSVVLGKSNVLH